MFTKSISLTQFLKSVPNHHFDNVISSFGAHHNKNTRSLPPEGARQSLVQWLDARGAGHTCRLCGTLHYCARNLKSWQWQKWSEFEFWKLEFCFFTIDFFWMCMWTDQWPFGLRFGLGKCVLLLKLYYFLCRVSGWGNKCSDLMLLICNLKFSFSDWVLIFIDPTLNADIENWRGNVCLNKLNLMLLLK